MYFTFLSGIKLKVLTKYFNIAEERIMLILREIQGELDVSVFAVTMIYYTKFTKNVQRVTIVPSVRADKAVRTVSIPASVSRSGH